MKSSDRNNSIDLFPEIKKMIDAGKISYSINQLEKDFEKFKFKSWVVSNKMLTSLVILILAPFTLGFSMLIWVLLAILSMNADKGYKNYLELVGKCRSIKSGDTEFSGDKSLDNDSYLIFLTKKYAIEKNGVLDKFICAEKLFNNIEEALGYADELEKNFAKKDNKEIYY
jgi:hypothetical protein